jgi:hypothetical protein
MLRKVGLFSACAALLVAAGALSACGSSSGGNGPGDSGELPDGGEDVFIPPGDGGEDSSADSSMMNTDSGPVGDSGHPDAGDGGCDFNTFVMQLIMNHTNSTDLPSTDLGQNCTDTQTPFPASFF